MRRLLTTFTLLFFFLILSSLMLYNGPHIQSFTAHGAAKAYSKIKVPGFSVQPGSRDNKYGGAMVMYKADKANDRGRFPFVMVYVSKCLNCPALEKSEWQKMRNNLMMMLSRVAKNDPNLVFEIDEMTMSGKKVITVYSESYVRKGRSTAAAYGLDVYFHNSKKQLKISVTSRSKSFSMAKSLQDMKERFTRQEMIDAAKKIFSIYNSAL